MVVMLRVGLEFAREILFLHVPDVVHSCFFEHSVMVFSENAAHRVGGATYSCSQASLDRAQLRHSVPAEMRAVFFFDITRGGVDDKIISSSGVCVFSSLGLRRDVLVPSLAQLGARPGGFCRHNTVVVSCNRRRVADVISCFDSGSKRFSANPAFGVAVGLGVGEVASGSCHFAISLQPADVVGGGAGGLGRFPGVPCVVRAFFDARDTVAIAFSSAFSRGAHIIARYDCSSAGVRLLAAALLHIEVVSGNCVFCVASVLGVDVFDVAGGVEWVAASFLWSAEVSIVVGRRDTFEKFTLGCSPAVGGRKGIAASRMSQVGNNGREEQNSDHAVSRNYSN